MRNSAGKYFCHDVRVIRLPRHGASLPIGLGVSCSADRQALGKITRDGVFLEELERNPARFLPEIDEARLGGAGRAHRSDAAHAGDPAALSRHPIRTRVSLTGPMVVARDLAHAKLRERLDAGGGLPDYLRNHPVYYAGPAKTPAGYASGSFGPTTAGRMDGYVDQFQAAGGSMVMLAKGNRSKAVREACAKHGGFLSRLDRRPGGAPRAGLHPQGRDARICRARHGGRMANRGRELSGLHRLSTTRATTSSRSSTSAELRPRRPEDMRSARRPASVFRPADADIDDRGPGSHDVPVVGSEHHAVAHDPVPGPPPRSKNPIWTTQPAPAVSGSLPAFQLRHHAAIVPAEARDRQAVRHSPPPPRSRSQARCRRRRRAHSEPSSRALTLDGLFARPRPTRRFRAGASGRRIRDRGLDRFALRSADLLLAHVDGAEDRGEIGGAARFCEGARAGQHEIVRRRIGGPAPWRRRTSRAGSP